MTTTDDVEEPPLPSKWRAMTLRDCIRIIEAFEFRGGISMWHPKLTGRTATAIGEPGIVIGVSIIVPHNQRDSTRADMNISVEKMLTLEEINRSMYPFADRVADIVRSLFEHEIDEGIFIAGKQARNPHRRADGDL